MMKQSGLRWRDIRKRWPLLFLILCLLLPSTSLASPLSQEAGPSSLDVVFVIDNSNSMWDPTYPATDPENLRIYVARALVDMLSIEADVFPTRIGVVTFGTRATLRKTVSPAATDLSIRDSIVAAHEDWTIPADAFRVAYEALQAADSFEPTRRPAVVFLTDGRPQNKRQMTEEDISGLFDDAEGWVLRFADEDCPLYILTFNVNETEVPVIDQARWQGFADLTRGAYYSVSSISKAVDVYYEIIASAILGGYAEQLVDQRIPPPTKVPTDIEVPDLVERLVVAAVRTDPVTQARLYRPDGREVQRSDDDLRYRGWGVEDHDIVWAIDRPESGTWRLEFEGGRGRIIAWRHWRPFEIVLTRPSTDVMHTPGIPLVIEAKLRDRSTGDMVTNLASDVTGVDLVMKITDPSGVQSPSISLEYDPGAESYTYPYAESAEEGKYIIQFILKIGEFEIAYRTLNVYVGLTPTVDAIEASEEQDNEIAGLQTGELLTLRVVVGQVERAEPGTLSVEYFITRPDQGVQTLAASPEEDVENIFVGTFGPYDQAGSYTLEVELTGQTTVGLDFAVPATETFELLLPPPPVLVELNAPGRVEVNVAIDVEVAVQVPGRGEPPRVVVEVVRDEETIITSDLERTGELTPVGDLLYNGRLERGIDNTGNYSLVVRLPDESEALPLAQALSVTPPLWLMIAKVMVALGIAGAIVAFAYWWFRVRLLVPRIVIGGLKIIEPETKKERKESLSDFNAATLTIGSGGSINLDKDPEIVGLRAKLIGRVKERRRQVPPAIISTDPDNLIEVSFEPVGVNKGEEVPLRNGSEIHIGGYRIYYTYKE